MVRSTLTTESLLEALRVDGLEFRAAVAGIDIDADVPSCPGWTVGTLVHHLTSVYRYVTGHVARAVTLRPDKHLAAYFAEAPAVDLLAAWDDAFERLTSTLEEIDPDRPAWNWAPQPKKAAFWHRRMAHETAIHRWDAQMATGRAEPIEGRLAGDGVSEVFDTLLPAGQRREHEPRFAIAELRADDIGHNWYVRLRGEGLALLDTETIFGADDPQPNVTAVGTASDLVLALWGRVGFDVLDVEGDEATLEALRTDDGR